MDWVVSDEREAGEAWHRDWLEAQRALEPERYRGLARADALLEAGRLGEGLLALEEDPGAPLAAAELRACWLVRLGSPAEASANLTLFRSLRAADGFSTPSLTVLRALLAQREGDPDEALLTLEQAAAEHVRLGAPRAAQRVYVMEAGARLARRRASDLERVVALCQGMPDVPLREALLAGRVAAGGGPLVPMLERARALPQRVLGAELLALGVVLARQAGERETQGRAEGWLLERLEELGLSLPLRLRAGLFEGLGRVHARAHTRVTSTPPSDERERLGRLFQTLTRLARERDLARLLERITDGAVDLTGAERGFVLLAGEGGPTPGVERRAGGGGPQGDPSAFSRSIAQAVIQDARPIVTVDAQHDPRVRDFASVHQLALTSVACVPIRGREGVLGALYLEHRMRRARFDADDLDLLLAFADQAAIALETHRALATLSAQRDRLAAQRDELEVTRAALEDALGRREVQLADTQRELARAGDAFLTGYERFGVIGRSDALRAMLARIERVRDVDLPVVLRGESGTGKELIARALHHSGRRREAPFVALSCGALTESLLESELFGHVRGAFTGAERSRDGVFVRARGGTLFLDELEDMPAKMQVDLLRVLQEGQVRPLGGDADLPVDVRVIGATRRPLSECVAAGTFREDLYYRLQVVEVVVPALRERLADLPLLAAHFLRSMQHTGDTPRPRVTPAALATLAASGLPGNVRQLEHLLTSAAVLSGGGELDASIFHELLGTLAPAAPSETAAPDVHVEGPSARAREDAATPRSEEDWKRQERERILSALAESEWNRARAALALGMPRRTFYRRLKEHGIL